MLSSLELRVGAGVGDRAGQTEGWAQSCWGRVPARGMALVPGSPLPLALPHSHRVESLDKATLVLLSWVMAEPGQGWTKASCLRPSPLPSQLPRPSQMMGLKELSGGCRPSAVPSLAQGDCCGGDTDGCS